MSSKTQIQKTLGLLALAGLVIAPLSMPAHADHVKKTTPIKLVCPVTGQTIDFVADAAGYSVYKGKKYYFCCSGCKPLFDKDPAKYIKAKSSSSN